MSNFCTNLPGIVAIGYCRCENIQPNIVLKYSSGIPVGVFTEITPVHFFGQPAYDAVEEYDNNGRKLLCTLKFVSNDNIPLHKHLAFVITEASGTSFIIGSRERPYPVVKSSATSGTPSGESNATTYEIKWSSVGMPIRCAI